MALSNMQIQTYHFPSFRGLNLKDGPLTAPPEFSRIANYTNFGLLGTIEKAKAPLKFNTVQLGTSADSAVTAMIEYMQNDGTKYFLAYAYDGKLYKISVTGVITDITPSNVTIAAGKLPHFYGYNNLMWLSDGVNPPVYVYDTVTSSKWFEIGLDAPTQAPTPALLGSGNVTGYHKYKYIYVSPSGAKSNPSPVSPVINATNSIVRLTNITVNSSTTDNTEAGTERWIYRTAELISDTSEGIYFFLHALADNTTTQWDDDVPDSDLAEPLEEDKDKPPAGLFGFTEYNGSVYGYEPFSSILWYSNINKPEAFGEGFNSEPIRPGDGTIITGLGALNGLNIFKQRSIHNWIGLPGLFARKAKVNGIGCVSHRTIKNVELPSGGDVLFFLSQYGPRFYDEQDAFLISREIEPIFNGTDDNYIFNHARAEQAVAEYSEKDGRKYFLSVAVNGATENNLLLVYDIYAQSWSTRSPFYSASLSLKSDSSNQQTLMGGDSRDINNLNGGWVFTVEGADDYYGEDYPGSYATVWNHLGYPNHQKLLRFLEIDSQSVGNYNLSVDIFLDGSTVPSLTKLVSLSDEGFNWDDQSSLWDNATWSIDTFNSKIIPLPRLKGRYIGVGFRTDTKDRYWKVLQARMQFTVLPNSGDRR